MTLISVFKLLLGRLIFLDTFGTNVQMKIDRKESHKSLLGAIVTMFIVSILVYKTVLWVKNVITKEDLSFSTYSLPLLQDNMTLLDFHIEICSPFSNRNQIPAYEFIYASSWMYDVYQEQFTYFKDLSFDQCPTQFGPHCQCLKFNSTDEKLPYVYTNTSFGDIMFNIQIKINFTALGITVDDALYNNDYFSLRYFDMYFDQKYVNISDYYDLVQSAKNFEQLFLDFTQSSMFDFFLSKVELNIINDAYTFGIVDPEINKTSFYKFDRFNNYGYSNYPGEIYRWDMYFRHSKHCEIFKITSFSFEDYMSAFGGYFQTLVLVFNLISTKFNDYLLNKAIRNKLVKRDKFHRGMIIEKIDKIIYLAQGKKDARVDVEKNEERLVLENNKNLIESEAVSVNKIMTQNYFNTVLCERISPERPIDQLRVKSDSEVNKLKIQEKVKTFHKVPKEDEFTDKILDDFENQIDYFTFYHLVKEVLILKIILLNDQQLNLFNFLNDIPFPIEKLSRFYEERMKSTNKEGLNVEEEKLNIVKEFFLNNFA